MTDLRWISWEQHGDAEHAPDCRPVAWPPPAEVLAFWETGLGGGEGADAYSARWSRSFEPRAKNYSDLGKTRGHETWAEAAAPALRLADRRGCLVANRTSVERKIATESA